MSGEALGVDAIPRRADILHEYKENVAVQNVVFGFRDLALLPHNTGHRGAKVLDEHLTTVCLLRGDKIYRLDTYISDVGMLNAFFV
jgi:hypothetical protein